MKALHFFKRIIIRTSAVTACFLLFACQSGGDDNPAARAGTASTQYQQGTSTHATSSNTLVQTAQADTGHSSAEYREGVHYIRVGEPQKEADGKVEVTEIFWYGCPHCYGLAPMVEAWKKNKPANADLHTVAAPLSGLWGFHARIFFTNEALGLDEQLHRPTFDGIHQRGKRFSSLKEVTDYYQEVAGVDPETYEKTFNSFSVDLEVKKAQQALQRYQINSVPSFVVGKAYKVTAQTAGSNAGVFNVIDYLLKTRF